MWKVNQIKGKGYLANRVTKTLNQAFTPEISTNCKQILSTILRLDINPICPHQFHCANHCNYIPLGPLNNIIISFLGYSFNKKCHQLWVLGSLNIWKLYPNTFFPSQLFNLLYYFEQVFILWWLFSHHKSHCKITVPSNLNKIASIFPALLDNKQ